RPHAWRMTAATTSNMLTSILDAFAFTLLIPFLNALFRQPELIPGKLGWLGTLQHRTVGALLDPAQPMMSLRAVIFVILALVIAPLLTLALQPILPKLRRGHRRLRGEYGEITSVLQDVISGVRLVKSFRGEPYEDTRFTRASNAYASGAAHITRVAFLSQ